MPAELKNAGHPMLAALLAVSLNGLAQAESPSDPSTPTTTSVSDELELLKEEETVSIATRYEQPISEAPSNVYVITDEDIRNSGAVDLPTILRRIPGMEVMQLSGAEFNVSVRGNNQLTANKLLVMVDGRSIYVDEQGQVYWKMLPVTLPEIKRIEVLKGPASALYGFNAFDGIINIITKSPDEMRGTTVQVGAGEFGTVTGSAIHAGRADKLGYRLSVGWNQNQQWNNRNALAFRDYVVNAHTEYDLTSESKLFLAGGFVDSNRFDGGLSEDTVSAPKPSQGYAYARYERPNFFIRAFFNRYAATDQLAFNPLLAPFIRVTNRDGSTSPIVTADTYNIETQHTVELGEANRLTYGINYRYNTLSHSYSTQYSTENRLGLYVQDEWKLANPLTLIAGFRYDLDTFIEPTFSPRVALLYRPARDHMFRISGSVAYRPPTLFEKTQDIRVQTLPPFPPSTASVLSGQSLAPEQIVSYEAEYQGWYLQHRLRARAALFFNHISDLISTKNETPVLATSVNDGGAADIYGGEMGAELLVSKWLSGYANFSYQEIAQSLTGRVQRAAPRFKWNAGLRSEWENGLNAEVSYHYYGAVTYPMGQSFETFTALGLVQPPDPRVGSYNLLNLRGGYRFWQQKAAAGYMREAEAAISVFNALNDKHKEHPLGETIGSRVMGWLTVRF